MNNPAPPRKPLSEQLLIALDAYRNLRLNNGQFDAQSSYVFETLLAECAVSAKTLEGVVKVATHIGTVQNDLGQILVNTINLSSIELVTATAKSILDLGGNIVSFSQKKDGDTI